MSNVKLTRRDFLRNITAGVSGAVIAKGLYPFEGSVGFAQSTCSSNRKVVISIFLAGGPHGPSILVPRSSQAYLDKHPSLGITNSMILDSVHGLNPLLTNIYNLYNQGFVAIGNGAGYPGHSRSHEDSTNIMGRGVLASSATPSGWVGRFTQHYCATSELFSMFSFRGRSADVIAPGVTAPTANSLANFSYQRDSRGLQNHTFVQDTIRAARVNAPSQNQHQQEMLSSWEVADVVAATSAQINSASNPPTYQGGTLGQRLRDARKLMSYRVGAVGVRHILISQGGYDTHDRQADPSNATNLPQLLTNLDAALGSFWADVSDPAVNLADDVVIVVYGEFGRTHENMNGGESNLAAHGTDHGTGGIMIVIGKNVRGGVFSPAYTDSDFLQPRPWVPVKFDYREVLAQIVERHQGVDPAVIFPEAFNRIGFNLIT